MKSCCSLWRLALSNLVTLMLQAWVEVWVAAGKADAKASASRYIGPQPEVLNPQGCQDAWKNTTVKNASLGWHNELARATSAYIEGSGLNGGIA